MRTNTSMPATIWKCSHCRFWHFIQKFVPNDHQDQQMFSTITTIGHLLPLWCRLIKSEFLHFSSKEASVLGFLCLWSLLCHCYWCTLASSWASWRSQKKNPVPQQNGWYLKVLGVNETSDAPDDLCAALSPLCGLHFLSARVWEWLLSCLVRTLIVSVWNTVCFCCGTVVGLYMFSVKTKLGLMKIEMLLWSYAHLNLLIIGT